MQVLQAGPHKLILLELDPEIVANVAKQAGFDVKMDDSQRTLLLELTASGRQSPLLLFDAADPGNLGWFSRCQFYIEGRTGSVMQTPMTLANIRDRGGEMVRTAVRLSIAKELPSTFRLPGRQPLTEQVVYAILFNLLTALAKTGVAVCGGPVVQPLAGRTEGVDTRN
ncbi:MAG: hypothetical protein IPM24_10480 [Bryobacterales bacterium]|nr:hypothetical protein [Bryobacterales bacterium]